LYSEIEPHRNTDEEVSHQVYEKDDVPNEREEECSNQPEDKVASSPTVKEANLS